MYVFQQIIFGYVFIIGSILVSLAIGVLVSKSNITLPKNTKFLFGCASTPFVIGMYTLGCTLIPLRLWNFLYYLPIYLISSIYLLRNKEIIISSTKKIEIPKSIKNFLSQIENIEILFFFHILVIQTVDLVNGKKKYLLIFFVLYLVSIVCKIIILKKDMQLLYVLKCSWEYVILFVLPILTPFKTLFGDGTFVLANAFIKKIFHFGMRIGLIDLSIIMILILGYVFIRIKMEKGKRNTKNIINYGIILFFFSSMILMRNSKLMVAGIQCLIVGILFAIYTIDRKNRKTIYVWFGGAVRIISMYSIFMLIYFIVLNFTMPIVGSDASEYLSNALAVVQNMNFSDINSYYGDTEGRLLAIIHHPNYVLYLVFALLHSFTGQSGYPFDFAARVAFDLNIIYFIISIWGITFLFKENIRKYISIVLPFGSITMWVLLNQSSRDGFRMIPLVMMFGLLCGINQQKKNEKDNFIAFFLCTAFVMMGHPINAVQAAIIILAYICWSSITRKIDTRTIYIGLSGLMGAAVGAAQIICAYIDTGRPTGVLINLNELLEDTLYGNNYMSYSVGRLQGSETFWERLGIILTRDYGVVMIPGLIAMVYIILITIKNKNFEDKRFFLALVVLVQSFTVLDIFSWSGFSLTEWYVKNMRYSLHLYVFLGVLTGCMLSELISKDIKNIFIYIYATGVVAVTFLIVDIGWAKNSYKSREDFVNSYNLVNDMIEKIGDSKEVMIDNYFCNYYLNNRATSFFTNDCKEIREAKDIEALDRALKNNNIGAVMIYEDFISVYWEDTLLLEYMHDDRYVEYSTSNDRLTIYKLRD